MDLRDLKSYNILKEKDAVLANQVYAVYSLTLETINGIARSYDNYTMHDMNHGLRVAAYMEDLAFGLGEDFDTNIQLYNPLELALLILSALLHDIGMFIRPEDEEQIRNNNIKYTDFLTYQGVFKTCNDDKETIKEIVRMTHAARIAEFIDYKIDGRSINDILLVNGNYPYSEDIVAICKAHGEDYSYVKSLRNNITKGSYTYNPQYIAVLLRIADYLDLDKQRTPILWYSMMGLKGFSREEWETHFIIQNEKKLRKYVDGKSQIYFDGKSANAKIHRKYLKYIDEIRSELENADSLLNAVGNDKKYSFRVSTKLDDCVQTVGFKYSDLRLSLDYSSITDLLMGKNIYGDSKLGLRELIQNSIDACKLMEEINLDQFDCPSPAIHILYSKKNNYVKIKDTGIGMSLDVVKKHFLNVGKSYYKSNDYVHKNYAYKPIGQFGIGFLACFLLSENVTIKTKYYKNNEINQIELEKDSEYVVTNTEQVSHFFGTEITLNYESFFEVFHSKDVLLNFIEKYFYTSIPIYVKDDDKDKVATPVNNFCHRIIDNLVKDTPKGKYEDVDCSKYAKTIRGVVKIRTTTKEKANAILSTKGQTFYVYNKEQEIFERINTPSQLQNDYYFLINYSNISDEDYATISKTRRSTQRKRDEILTLSKNQNKNITLLINKANHVDYMPTIIDDKPPQINECGVNQILSNSNLKYYPELINDSECCESIFMVNGMYAYLQDCYFEGLWHQRRYMRNIDNGEFFFYNREILVNQFRGMCCPLPFPLEAIGYVNYTGNHVKLDVSRNSIISGYKELQWEFTQMLLNYIKATRQLDEDLLLIVNGMLNYLETRLQATNPQ